MVSIIPGIDRGAPERTETSSGFCGSPKRCPVSCSSFARCSATSLASRSG